MVDAGVLFPEETILGVNVAIPEMSWLFERPGETASGTHTLDMERSIAALPTRARMVFVLHDVEGYQHSEIASMTGVAEGTSKAQLFRARRLLREALER